MYNNSQNNTIYDTSERTPFKIIVQNTTI